MSLWSRLKSWLGFGERAAEETGGETAVDAEGEAYAATCSVCGTGVDAGDEACPLCGSTDLAPASTAGSSAGGESSQTGSSTADRLDPTRTRSGRGASDDDAVSRLRELREREAEAEEDDDATGATDAGEADDASGANGASEADDSGRGDDPGRDDEPDGDRSSRTG